MKVGPNFRQQGSFPVCCKDWTATDIQILVWSLLCPFVGVVEMSRYDLKYRVLSGTQHQSQSSVDPALCVGEQND